MKRFKVLLVDRSIKVHRLVQKYLGQMDWVELVGVVNEPEQVAQVTRELAPDMVVFDFIKSGKFGEEALSEVRKSGLNVKTLSVCSDDRIKRALDLGVDEFVRLPLKYKEFAPIVMSMFDKKMAV